MTSALFLAPPSKREQFLYFLNCLITLTRTKAKKLKERVNICIYDDRRSASPPRALPLFLLLLLLRVPHLLHHRHH